MVTDPRINMEVVEPEPVTIDEMQAVLDQASGDEAILLLVEGHGHPKGPVVMLRSGEMRPGVIRSVWTALVEVVSN